MPISLKDWGALELCETSWELRKAMRDKTMQPDTFSDEEALALRVLWEVRLAVGQLGAIWQGLRCRHQFRAGDLLQAGLPLSRVDLMPPSGRCSCRWSDFRGLSSFNSMSHSMVPRSKRWTCVSCMKP